MKRLAHLILTVWSGIQRGVEALIILISLAMVASSMAQVISRYGLNAPLIWSEELSRYLFIWLSFLAAWLAWRRREHLGLEALADSLPSLPAAVLRRLVEAAVVVFAATSMYYGQRILSVASGQPSAVLRISMSWVYLAFYAGMAMIIAETLANWLARLVGREPGDAR